LILLMFISGVGFLVCLVVHVGILFGVETELGTVMQVLKCGILVVYLPAALAARRLLRDYGEQGFGEALKKACPSWMATAMGLIILYAIINVIVQLVGKADPGFAYSALLMAAYSTGIGIYYCYKRLAMS